MELAGLWQQAGRLGSLHCDGERWSSIAEEDWPDDVELHREINEISELPFGDRRQKLVVIGLNSDKATFRQNLAPCLLTDEEFGAAPELWANYADPIRAWELQVCDRNHDHGHDHGLH